MKIYLYICIIITITGLLYAQSASALEESQIDISVIKYDPQPVEPGQNFDIWVRVKNIGNSDAKDVNIEIPGKFPFQPQTGETGVRTAPLIIKGDSYTYRFSMKADDNAIKGNNKIAIGYRQNNYFTSRDFDIQIGFSVTDVKGVIELKKYQVTPEALMPGDIGQVTLTFRNAASGSSLKFDGKDYSTNAQVQSITMLDNPMIKVLSDSYNNVGIIGPGSEFDARYTIKVDNNSQNGIYFIEFDVVGSSNLRGKIPMKIEDSVVEIIPVEVSGSSISLNIANQRPNNIEAVSIIPYANNTIFKPTQYFIGTMQPNEVSTIKFEKTSNENENILLKARFKNDANWHESEIKIASQVKSNLVVQSNTGGISGSIFLVTIIFLIGFYKYMKQKRRKIS